jgi:hypothetical protein
MDSEAIALEMPMLVDTDEPRRGLVALLSIASLSVWTFAAMTTMQALGL